MPHCTFKKKKKACRGREHRKRYRPSPTHAFFYQQQKMTPLEYDLQ